MNAYNTFVYRVGEDKVDCYNTFVYLVGEDKDD